MQVSPKLAQTFCLVAIWLGSCSPLRAQIATFEDGKVALHGSFSQGFMYSTGNNYLTLPSLDGSFHFTDASFQVSTQFTPKLRVGAQVYDRSIGQLGKGHVVLDWALADYRFSDYFGIRAGKVKTVLGLYNDTQDLEFLHTWALLPQSSYPLDTRGITVAHTGGDIYGSAGSKKIGTFSYTGYAGLVPPDLAGGLQLTIEASGGVAPPIKGWLAGADLKWSTPVSGLLLGAGYIFEPLALNPLYFGTHPVIYKSKDFKAELSSFSAQYSRGRFRIDSEYLRHFTFQEYTNQTAFGPPTFHYSRHSGGWYGAVVYRINNKLEIGTYNSRFFPNTKTSATYKPPSNGPATHIYDQAVTLHIGVKQFWDVTIEGHFMNGYGDLGSLRGFYPQDNPGGFKPNTNLFVIRTGFSL